MGNLQPRSLQAAGEPEQVASVAKRGARTFSLDDLPPDLVWKVLATVRELDPVTWIHLRASCKAFREHISPQVQNVQLSVASATQLWQDHKWLHPAQTFPSATMLQVASGAPRELVTHLLNGMPQTKSLHIQHNMSRTSFWYLAEDLKALLPLCGNLTELTLPMHCSMESFEHLRTLTGLRSLGLSVNGRCHGHHIRNQHLQVLTELSALHTLRLLDVTCAAGHRMLPMLGLLSNLQALHLVDAKIDDLALVLISRLQQLKTLSIKAVKLGAMIGLTGPSVAQLRSLTSLERVQLHVRDSQKLRGVTPITLDLLCVLGNLPRLSSLALCGFAFPSSASSAQSSSRFSGLTELEIMSAGYVIPGCLEVLNLHRPHLSLKHLHLRNCHLHDPATITRLLIQHTNLVSLSLGAAHHSKLLSKAAFKSLLGLRQLEQLVLGLLEKGMEDMLQAVRREAWFGQLMGQVGKVTLLQGYAVATSCSRSCCEHSELREHSAH